jgi:hypothetical protein
MPGKGTVSIDTVPLPERPVKFKIPADLIKEFGADMRVVLKPHLTGIPVPDRLVDKKLAKLIGKNFQVMITPKG